MTLHELGSLRRHCQPCTCSACGNEWWRDPYTTGLWATEVESARAFDQAVEVTGRFTIWREVPGYYTQLRVGQEDKRPRIDRILTPTTQAIEEGWPIGPVGVELKRSGEKVGRPISQLLDYSRATWKLRRAWVQLEWLFLWPLERIGGPLESIMSQHRIGTVHSVHNGLSFSGGASSACTVTSQGLRSTPNGWRCGTKAGSR